MGASVDANMYIIICEYMTNGSLREKIDEPYFRAKKLPKLRVKILYEIIEGMLYLHGKNILHRDLNSGNILVWYCTFLTIA